MSFRNIRWRWMIVDTIAWFIAALVASELRFEFAAGATYITNYIMVAACAAALQVIVGYFSGVYRGRYRTATFDDFRATCLLVGVSALVVTMVLFALPLTGFPRSAAFGSAFFALALMLAARAVRRSLQQRNGPGSHGQKRVVLLGAGDAGEQLARSIKRDPHSDWEVVGFLDDSPRAQNLQLEGVRVLGTSQDIAKVSREYGVDIVIASIARIDADRINEINENCTQANVRMLVLPSMSQLIASSVEASDVREVNESDLLGRTVVDTDLAAITAMMHGKRILITGAGGSIGSEIARHLHPYGPAKLYLLDRDESALHALQLSLSGRALMDSDELVLADIRDQDRLVEVFRRTQPEIVFHAAALKHLPILQSSPHEAIKTNVCGTMNVLEASRRVGVEAFINISTDKAADPISVLGFSKRITERLTASTDDSDTGRYLSVRFGNVLGSRGSMLGTFRGQIERGGPVTVTHPDVSRYFMTIPEAVQLVLQASVVGRGGEVLVLDMGEPVRIADVAQRLVKYSGKRVEITYTGLRDGEKLDEDLLASNETAERTFHEMIMHVPVAKLGRINPQAALNMSDDEAIVWMARTATESDVSLPVNRNGAATSSGDSATGWPQVRRQ